jgi:hypothetical protein
LWFKNQEVKFFGEIMRQPKEINIFNLQKYSIFGKNKNKNSANMIFNLEKNMLSLINLYLIQQRNEQKSMTKHHQLKRVLIHISS